MAYKAQIFNITVKGNQRETLKDLLFDLRHRGRTNAELLIQLLEKEKKEQARP